MQKKYPQYAGEQFESPIRKVVMSCVQEKRRAAQREMRVSLENERRMKRARRQASGDLGSDDDSDTPPPRCKRGRPTKDDALVRRLAMVAGMRPEAYLRMDRIQYVDEEEEDKDKEEERAEVD